MRLDKRAQWLASWLPNFNRKYLEVEKFGIVITAYNFITITA